MLRHSARKVKITGDAAANQGLPLAPVASYEGLVVAANILQGNHQKPNYLGIPSVVFTVTSPGSPSIFRRNRTSSLIDFGAAFSRSLSSW